MASPLDEWAGRSETTMARAPRTAGTHDERRAPRNGHGHRRARHRRRRRRRRGLADVAIARLQELEARWSRFLPSSEISRLNRRRGVPVLVAPETFQLIDHALTAWRMTGGKLRSDHPRRPARRGLRPQLRAARSPGTVRTECSDACATARRRVHRRASHGTAPDIHLDRIVGTVRLGANTTFDAGGIGKGFAADLVVDELLSGGARGVLVNVGGDLRAAGEPPTGSAGSSRSPIRWTRVA